MPTQIELGAKNNNGDKASDKIVEPFKLKEFLREVKTEFLKISWPSKEQVSVEFLAVIILVIVITGIVYVFDILFGYISKFFMGQL